MRLHAVRPALLVLGCLALAGCGIYANVPPQTGDIATHDPNHPTIQKVMAIALRAVMEEQPLSGEYTVVLPPGTLPETYNGILPHVGRGATWSSGGNAPIPPVVEVKQVRVRGEKAEVDVVRPSSGGAGEGPPMLVTAKLTYDLIGGWNVRTLRLWRAGVAVEDH